MRTDYSCCGISQGGNPVQDVPARRGEPSFIERDRNTAQVPQPPQREVYPADLA